MKQQNSPGIFDLPRKALISAAAFIVLASLAGLAYLEMCRQWAISVLDQNGTTSESWSGPLGLTYNGQDFAEARKYWFTHPYIIVTGPTEIVDQGQLGAAIALLKPTEIMLSGDVPFEAHLLENLSRAHSVKLLDLWDCRVNDEAVRFVKQMKGLERLELQGTDVTAASLAVFHECPRLRWLNIKETQMSARDVEAFSRSHPHIEVRY